MTGCIKKVMFIIQIICLFACFFAGNVLAQTDLDSKVPVITLNPNDSVWLSDQIMIIDDGVTDADTPTSPEKMYDKLKRGEYTRHGAGNPSLGYKDHSVWLAFQYRTNGKMFEPMLQIAYPPLDHVTVYRIDTVQEKAQSLMQSGDQVPFEQRELNDPTMIVSLPFQSKETVTILVHAQTRGPMKIPMRLADSHAMLPQVAGERFIDGAYFAVLLLVVFLNLIFYISFRKFRYVAYIFYVLSFALFVASFKGYGMAYAWKNIYWVNQYSVNTGVFMSAAAVSWFSLIFLKMDTNFPKFVWVLKAYIGLNIFLELVQFILPFERIAPFVADDALICSVLLLLYGLLSYRKSRPAKLYSLAFLFQCSGIAITGSVALGLLPCYPWTEYSIQIGSLLQIIILFLALFDEIQEMRRSKELADAERIAAQQQNQAQLAAWNDELKLKVTEKTVSLQQLLDHSEEGFFKVEKDFTIANEYSAQCRHLFGLRLEGMDVCVVLAPDDDFQQRFISNVLRDLFAAVQLMQREVLKTLLPDQMKRNGFDIRISYKWIDPQPGTDAHLLVIATDITNELRLQSQMEIERERFEMVIQVFSHQDEFVEVLEMTEELLHEQLSEWVEKAFEDESVYQALFRSVHTLKGQAHQLKLKNLGESLHLLEEQLIQKHWKIAKPDQVVRDAWDSDVNVLQQWLGSSMLKPSSVVSIERRQLMELRDRLISLDDSTLSKEFLELLNRYLMKTMHDLLATYPAYVERIARTLDKWISPMVIEGSLVFVDPERFQGFVRSLVHMFRNMIDHGIESVDERVEKGKSEVGHVGCKIEKQENEVVIVIFDDGRGMHIEQIRKRAIQKGLIDSDRAEQLTDEETLSLIWCDGFSTKDQATELSGRGVGLSAVKEQVDQLGGQVHVRSVPGEGTEFRIAIPCE